MNGLTGVDFNKPREYHDYDNTQNTIKLTSVEINAILVEIDGSSVTEPTWRVIDVRGNAAITDRDTYESLLSKGYIVYGDLNFKADVRCQRIYAEYMSSPAQQYVPDTISELDIELEFLIDELGLTWVMNIGDPALDNRLLLATRPDDDGFSFTLTTNDVNQSFTVEELTLTSVSNLKIKGNGSNLEMYYNDVLVLDELVTISQDLTGLNSELLFSAIDLAGIGDAGIFEYSHTFRYVKINTHEWTFPEGSGIKTTNSQGVITAFHSTLDVEAMWFSTTASQLLLEWRLDGGYINDINHFDFSTDDLIDVVYVKGEGLNLGTTLINQGAIWSFIPLGDPEPTDYLEVGITPKSDPYNNTLAIRNITFDASFNISFAITDNFRLDYSLSPTFLNPITLMHGDIIGHDINNPKTFDVDIFPAIITSRETTVYFRIYPYNADNEFASSFVIHKNTFKINGFIINQ